MHQGSDHCRNSLFCYVFICGVMPCSSLLLLANISFRLLTKCKLPCAWITNLKYTFFSLVGTRTKIGRSWQRQKKRFKALNDKQGITHRLYHFGTLSLLYDHGGSPLFAQALSDAVDLLTCSIEMFGDPLHCAKCSNQLAQAYHDTQQYEQAQTCGH